MSLAAFDILPWPLHSSASGSGRCRDKTQTFLLIISVSSTLWRWNIRVTARVLLHLLTLNLLTNSCTSTRPSYIAQRCAVTNTKGTSYSIMPWLSLPLHEKEDIWNTCFDDLKLPSSCFHIPCSHKTWALVFARLCKIACRANQHSSYSFSPWWTLWLKARFRSSGLLNWSLSIP